MEPRRSDVKSADPMKVVDIDQQQYYVHLEPTKERFKGQVVHKDGFGQKVAFLDIFGMPRTMGGGRT